MYLCMVCLFQRTSTVALALRAESRVLDSLTRLSRSLACYKEIAVFTGMGKMFEISVNNSTCSAHTQITSRTLYRTIFQLLHRCKIIGSSKDLPKSAALSESMPRCMFFLVCFSFSFCGLRKKGSGKLGSSKTTKKTANKIIVLFKDIDQSQPNSRYIAIN